MIETWISNSVETSPGNAGVPAQSRRRNPQIPLTGAAGEAMAQVHLLMRGWVAANVNASVRNNAGFDLTATKDGRTVTIAVKAIGRGQRQAQWGRPRQGKSGKRTLFAGDNYPHFVVFIWFTSKKDAKEKLTEHRCFIVPTDVVDRDVIAADDHYLKHPRRDDGERAKTGTVIIDFLGDEKPSNIIYGFAHKWQKYEDAWDLLEKPM